MAQVLLEDETVVVAQRQHWLALAGPVCTVVAGLVLTLIAGFTAPARLGMLTDLAWKLWIILLAWGAMRVFLWRRSWFVATDKRLLMAYGVFWRRTPMMPLAKVTDMSFNRSPLGQFIDYGQFVLESAGRDQALRQIDFVRDARATYLTIVGEIFSEQEPADRELDDTDPNLHQQLAAARVAAGGRRDPTDVPIRTIGSYLPRTERPRRNGLRERILRRARDEPPPPRFGHENDVGWERSNQPERPRRPRDLRDD